MVGGMLKIYCWSISLSYSLKSDRTEPVPTFKMKENNKQNSTR